MIFNFWSECFNNIVAMNQNVGLILKLFMLIFISPHLTFFPLLAISSLKFGTFLPFIIPFFLILSAFIYHASQRALKQLKNHPTVRFGQLLFRRTLPRSGWIALLTPFWYCQNQYASFSNRLPWNPQKNIWVSRNQGLLLWLYCQFIQSCIQTNLPVALANRPSWLLQLKFWRQYLAHKLWNPLWN